VVAAVTAIVRMTKEKSLALKSVFMICGLTRDPALYAARRLQDLGKIEAAEDSGNSGGMACAVPAVGPGSLPATDAAEVQNDRND